MKYLRTLAAMSFLGIFVASCAQMNSVPPETEHEVGSPDSDIDNVLLYFRQLHKLSVAELRREQDAARIAFTHAPSDRNRIRLAIALGLPSSPLSDERHALELLDPVAKDSGSAETPLHRFAILLHAFVSEQIRLANSAHVLQRKIDALRLLEESLSERQRNAPRGLR